MKYFWKVYLWESGKKGTDYTDNVICPIFIEERLDETLDSGEIILENMPIESRNGFPPKTKFRIERYLMSDYSDKPKYWDLVVEHDDVEEYVGLPELCTHRIHLIETSVIAQGMHVDNIALTYKLNDVDLNYRTVLPDDTVIGNEANKREDIQRSPNHQNYVTIHSDDINDFGINWYRTGTFINAYKYQWDDASINGIRNVLKSIHAENATTVSFNVPSLYLWGCYNEGVWEQLFEVCTLTRVKKILRQNGSIISETYVPLNGTSSTDSTRKYSGATSFAEKNDAVCYCTTNMAYLRKINSLESPYAPKLDSFEQLYSTFPQVAAANPSYTKTCSFTTDVLSADDLVAGYTIDYEVECMADPSFQGGMISYYHQTYYYYFWAIALAHGEESYSRTETQTMATASNIYVSATIYCYDLAEGKTTPFLKKGVEYSCYDLVRKAMLTCDTYIIDNATTSLDEYGIINEETGEKGIIPSIDYPIVIEPTKWEPRLKVATMHETIFEQKNLWEVFLQVGNYLHAIPYLEFYDNPDSPDDKFVLRFRQLGDVIENKSESTKLTIFNSTTLSEYFSQYDSYVTNIFSPQNLCEEWLVCKTSDGSFLVSNDTAELQTKYAITEIEEFDIIYNGESKSALPYIFEKSIYDVLTNADPTQITPAKGNSIYYVLGDTKIQGFSYVAPSVSSGDNLMALKYIVQKMFGVQPSVWTQNFTFNNLMFRIKYHTQDTARITQFRPDLERFMKNSRLEKYPHHEQFFGQQDKIVDSERFSANLWGKLIRVGNNVFQLQEYAQIGEEREAGQLVDIHGSKYYVTACENEYYPDAIFQKITYSKNFNQLSNIVTIPSEPRFYEVSERSKIRREVRLQEFFSLTAEEPEGVTAPVYMGEGWADFLKSLIFTKNRTLPNYAWTRFTIDRKRVHVAENNQMFPSSEFIRTGDNTIESVAPSDHSDCIVPLLHFPLRDGIVFEWDMDDNFKAGDMKDSKISGGSTINGAYQSQQPLRYCDIMGKADLFRFALFNKTNWNNEQAQQLPKAVIGPPSDSVIATQGPETMAIALDKDNREEISFNYQINLLHGSEIITFPNIFGEKENDLKVCLLNKSQSLFDENVNITSSTILADDVPYLIDTSNGKFKISFGEPTWINGGISDLCAIVFYHENTTFGKTAHTVINVADLPNESKLQSWWICPVFNT